MIDILMAEVQTMQREVIDKVASPALTDTLDAYHRLLPIRSTSRAT